MSLIISLILAAVMPCETSWIEYDASSDEYSAVCGNADGERI